MNKTTKYIDISKYNTRACNFGMGDIYLEGFLNTDIPGETIYTRSKEPDLLEDFTEIYFDNNSLDVIRFSHVFEHFQRHEAIILLFRFNRWLKEGAILDLFMPDINACINEFTNAQYKRKKELLRHMFGSHESFWAIHCEGYFNEMLTEMLSACGFGNLQFANCGGQWPWVEVKCQKIGAISIEKITDYLRDFAPTGNYDEGSLNTLLNYWMKIINEEVSGAK